jgi:hypothetical protein
MHQILGTCPKQFPMVGILKPIKCSIKHRGLTRENLPMILEKCYSQNKWLLAVNKEELIIILI